MQFIPETPDEVMLADVAQTGHRYVLGFLELLAASVMAGDAETRRFLDSLADLADEGMDRLKARMEVGEE